VDDYTYLAGPDLFIAFFLILLRKTIFYSDNLDNIAIKIIPVFFLILKNKNPLQVIQGIEFILK
jgi:hypothetical protein